MRMRHRVPTVFTLSMLDVFCCALGCVILLWLWNERRAQARAKAAEESGSQLRLVSAELADARRSINSLTADLSAARGQIASLTNERDRTRTDLTAARGQAAKVANERDKANADLAASRNRVADLTDQLSKKVKDLETAAGDIADLLERRKKIEDALRAQIAQAQKRTRDLEVLTRDRDKELTVATAKVKDLTERLNDLDGQMRLIRTQSDASLDEQGKKLAAADARAKELEKFLSNRKSLLNDMQSKIDDLETDRRGLNDQLAKLRVAADNRFAGIQLTGRRVAFLVDMSGSMKMIDRVREAPDKWSTVVSTLVKVMKSLPDLEKFQVILFSTQVSFPLGGENDWLDYDVNNSADKVKQALNAIDPTGNTNMYDPLEAAFRLKGRGLDTIYLLSDGIPNEGPGLNGDERARDRLRQLGDPEKGASLGRHILKTLRDQWNVPSSAGTRVKINSIGFFYESPDLGAFLWALARDNDGSFVGMSKP